MQQITVIIPVYNGALTLKNTLDSLDLLDNKSEIDKVILIDDGSNDNSRNIIKDFITNTDYIVQTINHKDPIGLSASYNDGISYVKSKYILTMHQDIVIKNRKAISIMLKLLNTESVMAVYPILLHSRKLWLTYPYWQKCLFSRHIERNEYDLTGKFDCFRSEYLKHLGGFNSKNYKTAGEDADLKHRIRKAGYSIKCSQVKVLHAQEADAGFNFKKYIRKESQLAEARGAVLRIQGTESFRAFVANFFREIFAILLLVPIANIIILPFVLLYCYQYTKNVYKFYKFNLFRDIKLYLVNFLLLFVNIFFSTRAFIFGEQKI